MANQADPMVDCGQFGFTLKIKLHPRTLAVRYWPRPMIFRFWPFYSRKKCRRHARFSIGRLDPAAAAGSSAPAFTTNDASTIFESYAKAFYSLKGDNGYFKKDQAGGTADFWEQAEEIECVIDACERKTNPAL